MKKIIITVLLGLLVLSPVLTFAAPDDEDTSAILQEIDLTTMAENITTTIVTVFFIVAVLGMIAAAFMFLTAGGDTEKTKKAKVMLINAIIAITIGVLAYSAKPIIRNFLKKEGEKTSAPTELVAQNYNGTAFLR